MVNGARGIIWAIVRKNVPEVSFISIDSVIHPNLVTEVLIVKELEKEQSSVTYSRVHQVRVCLKIMIQKPTRQGVV